VFSPEYINSLLENILANPDQLNASRTSSNSNTNKKNKSPLTPSQALVIMGLIGGVLNVQSILVDSQQTVNIVLQGSLKRKTEMDKILDKMGSLSFEEVMTALFARFG